MNPNKRQPNETQRQYRERLRAQNKSSKTGRVLWDSSVRGTYVKAKHGPLL